MKIVVITDCIHYSNEAGISNKNPILTKQFEALLANFEEVSLVAPILKRNDNVDNFTHYSSSIKEKTNFYSCPPVGGNNFIDKLKIVWVIPKWLKLFWQLKNNDLYYLRFPNNLNIISFLFYFILKKKIIITYTGTWENYKYEPWTYKLQKIFIKYLHVGPAFVYSLSNSNLPKNIFSSYSPSFSNLDCYLQEFTIKQKVQNIDNFKLDTLEFVSVGSVVEYKNQLLAIKVIEYLSTNGLSVRLRIVGEDKGEYFNYLKKVVHEKALSNLVFFEGFKSGKELDNILKGSHFLVHTPKIEGYGKTPQEALFYGLIPILSDFPFAPFFVGNQNERGFLIDDSNYSNGKLLIWIKAIINSPENWKEMIESSFEFSKKLTIDIWVESYVKEINKLKIES